MKEYLSIKQDKKEKIIQKIKLILSKRNNVKFAYIFGSFLESPSFRDIDIGIYIDKIKKNEIFDYELELSTMIAKECELSFDIVEIKVLNFAPNSFLNNIFSRGKLLFTKDEKSLTNMIENSSIEAIANEYISYQSLKELIPI